MHFPESLTFNLLYRDGYLIYMQLCINSLAFVIVGEHDTEFMETLMHKSGDYVSRCCLWWEY